MTLSDLCVVRPARDRDAAPMAAIYNHYITNTIVTFEEEPITADDMRQRVAGVIEAGLPWFVAEISGDVIGYAYATGWRGRPGYRFSCEVTVYLAAGRAGQGTGSLLYGRLLDALRQLGRHLVIGGIALPNDASVALHEKFGFTKVAHFGEVGRKFERWIDVGFWELRLAPVTAGNRLTPNGDLA